ncbi:MAG: CapA family protein, partial [Chrysiogenales bacterium]
MRRISFFVVICLVAVPYSCKSKAREARISFVGDIIMHIPVKNCARSRALPDVNRAPSSNNMGFDHLFERIKDDLEGSDIVVGNMEFPVSPPYASKPRIFNCRPEVLPAMKKAGFTMMHLANNHILDQGEGGVTGTMSHVRESGMDYVGVGENEDITRAGLVKTIHGIRIGFIGYTGLTNYSRPRNPTGCHINWFYDREKVLADIRAIKSRVDYLVMIVHNGVEYANIPAPNDVRLIKNYIESGVDLVIGHHSHILQPVERIVARDGRVCFIFYSLGNFLSNQNPSPSINIHGFPLTPRDSAVINCILRS